MVKDRSSFFSLNASVLAFFFCCLIIAGLFTTHFARSLSSIGTIGLGLTAIFSLFKSNTLGDDKFANANFQNCNRVRSARKKHGPNKLPAVENILRVLN